MGGWGSGRPRTRSEVECYASLDVRQLARRGLLGSLKRVDFDNSHIFFGLASLVIRNTVAGRSCATKILFSTSRCGAGGRRWWFLCPTGCGRRVALIYRTPRGLLCRRCANLAYASQFADTMARTRLRLERAARRLNVNADDVGGLSVSFKPKGMHRTTFAKRLAALKTAEGRWDDACMAKAAKLFLVADSSSVGSSTVAGL